MGLVNYLKTQMKISKPFLFIMLGIICFMLGLGLAFLIQAPFLRAKEGRIEKLTSQVTTLEKEIIKTNAEWASKMKKATKIITVKQPDGSEKIIETSNEEVDATGKIVVDYTRLAESTSLLDKTSTYKASSWGIHFQVIPTGVDFGSYKNYNFNVSIEKDLFWGLSMGPLVNYRDGNFEFGLSVGYRF